MIGIDFLYLCDRIPRIYRRRCGIKIGTMRCRNFFVVAAVVSIRSADRWIDDPLKDPESELSHRTDSVTQARRSMLEPQTSIYYLDCYSLVALKPEKRSENSHL